MKSERLVKQINKLSGDEGEREVVRLVACPNCARKLMILPPSYPLYDVQCSGCSFRAQVKTNRSRPKKEIFGAGWDIMSKVMKSGYPTPALLVNFKWEQEGKKHQEIRFYPFIPKGNLKKRQLSNKHKSRPGYWMFNYIGLDKLPFISVFSRP
jgi:hypothetical protein